MPRVEDTASLRRPTILSGATAALLAYLLLNGRRHHNRSALVGRFWGDSPEPSARSCLNTALWRLRQALEPEGAIPRGTYLHATSKESVSFNWDSAWWVDVLEFEDRVEQAVTAEETNVAALETAVDLYRSCLLEGNDDPWITRERDRFETLHLEGLTLLLEEYASSGDHRSALACGRQILWADPLREDVHRLMMRVYADQGQRSMVMRQYRWCVSILDRELGIDPLAETEALYAGLVGGEAGARPRGIGHDHELRAGRPAWQVVPTRASRRPPR